MKKHIHISTYLLLMLFISSCYKGVDVDLIIHNANIHSMNIRNDVFEAMAIKDGEIIELGPEREIMNKYSGREIDAEKRDIYPGFYDAHTHIFSYAKKKLTCDLTNARSMNEVLSKLERYVARHNPKIIVGRGWDQSLWVNKSLPNNDSLSKMFPNTPVILYRIDGHCLLANKAAIKKAEATEIENVAGGKIIQTKHHPTGIFIDNAMNLIQKIIPPISPKKIKATLMEIQEELLQYGITNINEAGITIEQLHILQELEKSGKLKINIYAMLQPGEREIAFAREHGIYKTAHLNVRSFKVIADGALGSRGACLSQPYTDDSTNFGSLLHPIEYFKKIAEIAFETGYQMNTHCIGDSANHIILKVIEEVTKGMPDHRWRIEHAQVVNPTDIALYAATNTIPSVQPTHAVSDMRFVAKRLGSTREKWSYAYKKLLNATGIIAIGTDFPVEQVDPFLSIEAAVNRKNAAGKPNAGYLPDEALTLEQCLRGMTIWSAIACFEENEQGTLEPYKDATFVVLYNPLAGRVSYINNYAKQVFNKGKSVYLFE